MAAYSGSRAFFNESEHRTLVQEYNANLEIYKVLEELGLAEEIRVALDGVRNLTPCKPTIMSVPLKTYLCFIHLLSLLL